MNFPVRDNKVLLYCIVLYCIVLYCIVLYCIVLYCIVLYCIVLYCIVLYCIVLYCIVLYCIVLYCIVLYCIVLYCIVLYCIVLTSRDACVQRKLFTQTLFMSAENKHFIMYAHKHHQDKIQRPINLSAIDVICDKYTFS